MIKYVCHSCNDLECETSVCPVCKKRASLSEVTLFYCPECNAPCFDDVCPSCGSKTLRIGNDVIDDTVLSKINEMKDLMLKKK